MRGSSRHPGRVGHNGISSYLLALSLARNPCRQHDSLCPGDGRIRCNPDGGGQSPWPAQTLSMAVYDAVQAGAFQQANLLVLIITMVSTVILYGSVKLLQTTWR